MSTLSLFHFVHYPLRHEFFFEAHGDFTRLQHIYIESRMNSPTLERQKELAALLWGDAAQGNGARFDPMNYVVTRLNQPTKHWDIFVPCGWL